MLNNIRWQLFRALHVYFQYGMVESGVAISIRGLAKSRRVVLFKCSRLPSHQPESNVNIEKRGPIERNLTLNGWYFRTWEQKIRR